jgi:hypothetical protein
MYYERWQLNQDKTLLDFNCGRRTSVKQTSENVPVNLFSNVDFPTEGKPTKPTRASPLFVTSNPSPALPPPPFDDGVSNSHRNFASLACTNQHHKIRPNTVHIHKAEWSILQLQKKYSISIAE